MYSILVKEWKLNRQYDAITTLDDYSFTLINSFDDIGQYLVDETMQISDRMDYGEPFEYGGLSASFTILNNPTMDLIKANFIDTESFYTCEIIKDGNPQAYGLLEKEDMDFDRKLDDYQINVISLFSFVYNLENRLLPEISALPNSSLSFLDTPLLLIFGDLINQNGLVIDSPLDFNLSSSASPRAINQVNYMGARANGFTVKEFIDEVSKKFICYLDITPTKRLQLISYNQKTTIYPKLDISSLIEDETYTEKVYTPSKYVGAVVNYNYPQEYDRDEEIALGGSGQPTTGIEIVKGYALVKKDGKAALSFREDIPDNILDLREKTYKVDDNFVENTEILIFFVFTEEDLESREGIKQAYNLLKGIINPQKIVECELYGDNYYKFQNVTIGGEEFIIKEFTKDDKEKTKVTLTSYINN